MAIFFSAFIKCYKMSITKEEKHTKIYSSAAQLSHLRHNVRRQWATEWSCTAMISRRARTLKLLHGNAVRKTTQTSAKIKFNRISIARKRFESEIGKLYFSCIEWECYVRELLSYYWMENAFNGKCISAMFIPVALAALRTILCCCSLYVCVTHTLNSQATGVTALCVVHNVRYCACHLHWMSMCHHRTRFHLHFRKNIGRFIFKTFSFQSTYSFEYRKI